MKQLIVTRHAKSSWDSNAPSDFQRPLNKRGVRDTPIMAERLKERGTLPELVLSSTAVRALETTDLLMATLGLKNNQLLTTDSIYEAPLPALEQAVNNLPDHISAAMMLGVRACNQYEASAICWHSDDTPDTTALYQARDPTCKSWK